jgi:hypothetical protein
MWSVLSRVPCLLISLGRRCMGHAQDILFILTRTNTFCCINMRACHPQKCLHRHTHSHTHTHTHTQVMLVPACLALATGQVCVLHISVLCDLCCVHVYVCICMYVSMYVSVFVSVFVSLLLSWLRVHLFAAPVR